MYSVCHAARQRVAADGSAAALRWGCRIAGDDLRCAMLPGIEGFMRGGRAPGVPRV